MASRETAEIIPSRLFLIKVRFAPSDLPAGAVDALDLANFLDGMQLVLGGLVGPDSRNIPRIDRRQQFAVVGYQQGSTEIFVTLQMLLDLIMTHTMEDIAVEVNPLVMAFLNAYVTELGKETAKSHSAALADVRLDQTETTLTRFKNVLRQAVSRDISNAPPTLQKDIRSGLKKMAQVGGKASYNPPGIQVSDNVEPADIITFDMDAAARITHLIAGSEESTRLIESRYEVELVGAIEEANRIEHTFRLAVSRMQGITHTKCVCPAVLDDLVARFYASGERVKVTGIRRYQAPTGRRRRTGIIEVTDVQSAGALPL